MDPAARFTAGPPLRERYAGCLVGAGLGDAMGKLTEFLDEDGIRHHYGASGLAEPPQSALYTDDTQLALATARALLRAGGEVLPALMEVLAAEYLVWLEQQDSPNQRRAPGVAVMDALGRVKRGTPYTTAGDGGANDSIAATRSIPIALRYYGDHQKTVEVASEVARMTHAHPAAVSAAAAAALLTGYALAGVAVGEWVGKAVPALKRWCPDDSHQTVEALRTAERTLDWEAEDAMYEQFRARPGYGGGWTADEAVGLGLWCFLRSPDDFAAAVRQAANAYGDCDTDGIAFVTGALAGAHGGLGALPAGWAGRLEDGDEIQELAGRLYELRTGELER
jgi:ADP-ribosylglycohydrolase